MDEKLKIWRKRNWVSLRELAEFFEVSPKTITAWWKSGETSLQMFQAIRSGKHCLRFTAESCVKFVEAGFVAPEDYME